MVVDLKRELVGYRATVGRYDLVTLPPRAYIAVDGHGDPNTASSYRDALTTLYPVAYALKFFSKNELGRDYRVMPLEALWWSQDLTAFTQARNKDQWSWTAMILVPSWLDAEQVQQACDRVAAKGTAPSLAALRYTVLNEARAVQTLHVGSYDDEGPTIEAMHNHAYEQSLRLTGTHHEIYLSDARRVAPDRLRTILRQPVTDA